MSSVKTHCLTAELCAQEIVVWRNDDLILNRVSFTLSSGQTLLVTGHNGSGKTTLLRVLASLRTADEGVVLLNGVSAASDRLNWAHSVAYCGHHSGLSDRLTVRENLSFLHRCHEHNPRNPHNPDDASHSTPASNRNADIDMALDKLAIGHLGTRILSELSAGQRRRATLAGLLVRRARVWLLDEPFTAIDSDGRQDIERLVIDHTNGGGICVMTSHQDLLSQHLLSELLHLNLEAVESEEFH